MRISDWSSDVCSSDLIAQPTLSLSTVPIFTKTGLAPRHVDLRPFVLMSPQGITITPGGLTRVAMSKGSLRSEAHTAAIQSLMSTSYDVLCLIKKHYVVK